MKIRISSAIVLCAAVASSVFFCGCKKDVANQIYPHDCVTYCVNESGCPKGTECVYVDRSQAKECCQISQTPPTEASAFTGEGSVSTPITKNVEPGETAQVVRIPILQRETVYTDQQLNFTGSITTQDGGVPSSLPKSLTLTVGVVRIGCPTQMFTPLTLNASVGPQGKLVPLTGFAPLVPN